MAFSAQALAASAPVIGHPKWAALPTREAFAAAIPSAARDAGVLTARVVLNCKVGVGGSLEACRVESEEPSGFGYADAALSLSSSFRLNLWSDEGLPTIGGTIRAPIRFDLRN